MFIFVRICFRCCSYGGELAEMILVPCSYEFSISPDRAEIIVYKYLFITKFDCFSTHACVLIKILSSLTGMDRSYGKNSSRLAEIPTKSSKIGWLASHMNRIPFYKVFIRIARSRLSEPGWSTASI